ncbi:MAG: hypothetical protein ACREBR_05090 [bacterium]
MKKSEKQQLQSPQTTQTPKPKSRLYIGVVQDEFGKIQRVFPRSTYDEAWLISSTESKAIGGFWEIRDFQGREIDGNYRSRVAN